MSHGVLFFPTLCGKGRESKSIPFCFYKEILPSSAWEEPFNIVRPLVSTQKEFSVSVESCKPNLAQKKFELRGKDLYSALDDIHPNWASAFDLHMLSVGELEKKSCIGDQPTISSLMLTCHCGTHTWEKGGGAKQGQRIRSPVHSNSNSPFLRHANRHALSIFAHTLRLQTQLMPYRRGLWPVQHTQLGQQELIMATEAYPGIKCQQQSQTD